MIIDKKTFAAKQQNFYKTDNPKTQIVIGFSLREGHNHIMRMQTKEYGNSRKWNTYTISRDGIIYQHFNPKKHCDFLGIKEADIKIISIVLENTGYLVKNDDGIFVNLLNEVCDEERIGFKKWDAFSYWEKFTEEQIMALVDLCNYLSIEFSIPNDCIEFQNYHKSIIKYKGIAFRSNYLEKDGDANPLFEIEKFNKLLHVAEKNDNDNN